VLKMRCTDRAADYGAFRPIFHALVLFYARCMNADIIRLWADGFDVSDEDVARLSHPSSSCRRAPQAHGMPVRDVPLSGWREGRRHV
jgi:hypothetical protein